MIISLELYQNKSQLWDPCDIPVSWNPVAIDFLFEYDWYRLACIFVKDVKRFVF